MTKLKLPFFHNCKPTPILNVCNLTCNTDSNIAFVDSGATSHYLKSSNILENTIKNTNIFVNIPDGNTLQSSHECSLQNTHLSPNGNRAYILPDLKSSNLLSVGQLCDDGCDVIFSKTTAKAIKNDKIVFEATRDFSNGMWTVPLTCLKNSTPPQESNAIIQYNTAKHDVISYLHAACMSPTPSTWMQAIDKGFFSTWPGVTSKAVKKYLIPSQATTKGHLDQESKNQLSSQPLQTPNNLKTHEIMCNVVELPKGKIFTDQTGRFPVQSSKGNNYVFVLYDFDSNAILTEPIKNRKGASLIHAFNKLTDILISKGFNPKFQVLDNEASQELKTAINAKKIQFQLAPPHIHRRNAAERAIRTFKNHFIAALATCDPEFPLYLWDELLHQCTITLNLLRQSRINPTLSAYNMLFGHFNFLSTPLHPPGTKCELHEKPHQRKSWASHSITGWYIGPAMEHYRCHRIFLPSTGKIRIGDTVQFFPTRLRMPKTSSLEKAISTANDLVTILQNPEPASPFLAFGNAQFGALQQLADMFSTSLSTKTDTSTPRVVIPKTPQLAVPRVKKVSFHPNLTQPSRHEQTQKPTQLPTVTPSNPPLPTLRRSPRIQNKRRSQHLSLLHKLAKKPQYSDFTLNFIDKKFQHVANPVIDPLTGRSLEYRHLLNHKDQSVRIRWGGAMCKELGRLAQGYKDTKGTNCITFIPKSVIPSHKKATYARIVSEIRPQKDDPFRIRITVGGNLIYYPHDKSQPTADLTTVKLHINSTISTPGAKYACLDIKNMYLMSLMQDAEFMFIDANLIPQEFIDSYNLQHLIHNGKLYIQINKGMYGLPQAGKLAHDQLKAHLTKFGYYPCSLTAGLWKHTSRPISFTLVVDDFGVKYVGRQHLDHLISALKTAYEITVDLTGSFMLGMTLDWNYTKGHVDISMPTYIEKALRKFTHAKPKRHQYQPHPWIPPLYGAKVQYATSIPDMPILSSKDTQRIQEIVGTLLYYARAVDPTILPALNDIGSQQAHPTTITMQLLCQLLDYVASNPNAIIRYTASNMILHIHSDGSYLSAPKARSRAAGHFFLTSKPANIKQPNNPPPPPNGPVHTVCKTMRNVVASAAEAELGSLFFNCQEAVPLRNALREMNHPQPATPVQTDNTTALGIVTSSIRRKRSKAMDMRFHWVQDQTQRNNFLIYWAPGKTNLADYFSKHHPAAHHKQMRNTYLLNHIRPYSSHNNQLLRHHYSPHNFKLSARARVCSYISLPRSTQYSKCVYNIQSRITNTH